MRSGRPGKTHCPGRAKSRHGHNPASAIVHSHLRPPPFSLHRSLRPPGINARRAIGLMASSRYRPRDWWAPGPVIPYSFSLGARLAHRALDGACLTEDRLALLGSIVLPQRPARFLPLPAAPSFLAKQESLGPWPSSTSLRPCQVRADRPRSDRQPSRPRWARPEQLKKEYNNGNHRLFYRFERRLRLRLWKCPLARRFVTLARRRPGQVFPQRSEDNA
jgi:hypothetical protein